MCSAKRKNFYIAKDLIPHIENQPNQSYYINTLVRQDVAGGHKPLSRQDIIDIVREHLADHTKDETPDLFFSIKNILKGDE